ncbi:HesA/MoeB/ThiF family protein [Stappia stellulata]|uniref:HesA/MoeB/ThiF family protein n=1 Tax=Stappia stellulata TaxID=71235 RepID=UPI0004170639|nr:ThiF family adenylyltransferase [Stappia stellulata]
MDARDEIAKTLLRLGKTEFDMLRADALPGSPAQDWTATLAVTHTPDSTVWTVRPFHLALPAGASGVWAQIRALAIDGETAFHAALDEWADAPVPDEAGEGPEVRLLIGIAPQGPPEIAARWRRADGWCEIDRMFLEGQPGSRLWSDGTPPAADPLPPERVARFTSSFGVEAYQRLRRATAVVIGAGGTGSVAIPMLARAGVGKIVIVDSDVISPSNLERTHASFPEHIETPTLKATLARDHVRSIDPDIEVIAFDGRLPQRAIVEEVAQADVLLGCTDQHTSRLVLSDMARRYLVPAIDCGGLIEGANGLVTGQIIQLVLFRPHDPCPRCRGMVDDVRMRQELMSPEERQALIDAAGDQAPPPEAHEVPQIDTVGYITTTSGTLAAGYAIGWLTGRFDPPFERMQMNLIADCLDVTDRPQPVDEACTCQDERGLGDAGALPFDIPSHWGAAKRL